MGFLYSIMGKPKVCLGREEGNDIVIGAPYISRFHFIITRCSNGCTARLNITGRNGVRVNNSNLSVSSIIIGRSDIITLGDYSIVWMGDYIYVECTENYQDIAQITSKLTEVDFVREWLAEVDQSGDDEKKVFRPTIRKYHHYDMTPIEIEPPPARKIPEKQTIALAIGPALTMAIPMVLGCGRVLSALSAVFAALWAMGNVLNRKRKSKMDERRRKNSYLAYIRGCEEKIRIRYEECRRSIIDNNPKVEMYFAGEGNLHLMWNKSITDDGFLIRIGVGRCRNPVIISIPKEKFSEIGDSLTQIPARLQKQYSEFANVPVCVDFHKTPVLGIVSDSEAVADEIMLALLMQLLVNIGPTELSVYVDFAGRLAALTKCLVCVPHICIITRDQNADKNGNVTAFGEDRNPGRNTPGEDDRIRILITNSSESVRDDDENDYLCRVILSKSLDKLPASTDTVIYSINGRDGVIKLKTPDGQNEDILMDRICIQEAEEYARLLGRMGGMYSSDTGIPETVDFDRLFDKEYDLDEAYSRANTCYNIRFPIGVAQNEEVIYLDLHEKKEGPHGIVCGMTGSGKSELLTTIILSASLCYPPDQLGFFLIDYKGGGMANLFKGLPHLMGNISNLSVTESGRALISIKSENIRRQCIFNDCNVNNINDYTKGYLQGIYREPLPHIIIIIDEFAEMKKEQPDFLQEIISLSAVGRSLGIHLILATQKPGGVIDERIKSNTKFRIALRVMDRMDSVDVIGTPDANYLVNCGRAYIQVGNNEVYRCFQSAYAMASVEKRETASVKVFNENMEELVIWDKEEDEEAVSLTENTALNWHEYFMKQISQVCKEASFERPHRLWLDSLPEVIPIGKLTNEGIALAVGDDLKHQRYADYCHKFDGDGNICIIGPPGSGKTQFLYNILWQICLFNRQAAKAYFYVAAFGGEQLNEFSQCPECGGLITVEEESRLPMLFRHIREVIERRRRAGWKKSARDSDESLPDVIVILDNFGEIIKRCGPLCEETVNEIIRNGEKAGVYIVISALFTGTVDVPQRVINGISKVMVLGKIDAYYTANLMKTSVASLPSVGDLPGRGIAVIDEEPIEIQLLWNDKKPPVIELKALEFAEDIHFPYIPDRFTVDVLFERFLTVNVLPWKEDDKGRDTMMKASGGIPVGLESDTGKLYMFPVFLVKTILVSGRESSGKKSFLEVIATSAARYNISTISVYTPQSLIENITRAKQEKEFRLVLVPDMDRVLEEFYNDISYVQYEDMLCEQLSNESCRDSRMCLVGIVSDRIKSLLSARRAYAAIMRKSYGIYFGGMLDDSRIFDFSYIPYGVQAKVKQPGEATVMRHSKRLFYGDVIIPKMIWMEEE